MRSLFLVGSSIKSDSLFINNLKFSYEKGDSHFILNDVQKRNGFELRNLDSESAKNKNIIIRDSLLSYYNMKSFGIYDNLLVSRWNRWIFSWKYFNEQNLNKKLFGDSFEYLTLFPKVFYIPDIGKLEYDYPHNPIISTFLFSGFLGGILYVYFLAIIFIQYLKKFKKYLILIVVFMIAFIFTLFSGNSHFSIPLFAILSVFPFLNLKVQND
jgi:hypothetical protein